MKKASPYKPGAGTKPPYLAGRQKLLEDAEKSLQSAADGYFQKSVIYYGLRGVGKTVLLNAIEDMADDLDILYEHIEIAEKKSFLKQISIASNRLIHRLSIAEAAKDVWKKAWGYLQAFNVTYNPEDQTFTAGISEPSAYITTRVLSEDMTELFLTMGKTAEKAGKVICFFIDEIQYMREEEMEALVNALHRVNQKGLPIILYGAGLPKVLSILGDVKSYAERLFKYEPVDRLADADACEAVVKPAHSLGISYAEDAVQEILKWSHGYPYFLQEICNIVWKNTEEKECISLEDVENVIPTFLKHLDKSFFRMRYERCTKKEHDFLFAMVRCGELPCTISNVAMIMKKRVNSISPLRAQLISKGIIYSTGRGEIDFTVPLFDEYLKRINPELKFDGE